MVIKCPNCGNQINSSCKHCPDCGAPVERPERKPRAVLIIILTAMIAVIAFSVAVIFGIYRRVADMTSDPHSGAYTQDAAIDDDIADNTDHSSQTAVDNDTIPEDSLSPGSSLPAPEDVTEEDLSDGGSELISAGYKYIRRIPRAEAGQVLVDQNGLKVTFDGLGINEYSELAAQLTVENSTPGALDLFVNDTCINTYKISSYSYASLPAGSKTVASVGFYSGDINLAGFSNIGELVFEFEFDDPETFEPVLTAEGRVKTDDYDMMDTAANDEGFEIGNENGLRIVAKSLEPANDVSDDLWVIFYLENNSGREAAFVIENVFINGAESDASLYCELKNGAKAVQYAFIGADELTFNSISRIDEMELDASVHDTETFETVADFGTVDLNVTYGG